MEAKFSSRFLIFVLRGKQLMAKKTRIKSHASVVLLRSKRRGKVEPSARPVGSHLSFDNLLAIMVE